jgi:hypothetical protein
MKAKPKRKPDPLIDEIRAIRKSLHDRFGGDLEKHAAYANEVARQYLTKQRTQSRSPKKR